MNWISFAIGFLFGNLFAFFIGFGLFMNTTIYFMNKYGDDAFNKKNE